MIFTLPECLLKHVLLAKNKLLAIPKKNPFDLYTDIRLLGLDQSPTETGAAVYEFKNDSASHLDVLRFKNLPDSSIEGIGRHMDNIIEKHKIDAIVMGLPLPLVGQTRRHPYPDPTVSPALLASLVPDPYWGLSAAELASPAYSGVHRLYAFANSLSCVFLVALIVLLMFGRGS